ncbi:sigma-54-dependent Fis family transcriptional regulator [Methylocystis sp. Sn-Cys]|uniref:sigma-54-dependent Fis family transcriptional regulator n=1 Tax=Methylocystis sp. Sn-Cys TaxID=1701263 RepID=UPI001FED6AF2|nr:sigma 54-interacting transcriptional regulator [Methylocystis sp. Sn-Cys]
MSDFIVRQPCLEREGAFAGALCSAEATGLYGVDRPGVAWDWMKQTGQAPCGVDWVRPLVADAWMRCVEDHALPTGLDFPPRQRQSDGFVPEIDATSRAASGAVASHLSAMIYDLGALLDDADVTLLLADAAGRVIHLLDSGRRIWAGGMQMARIGADWREASLGANGVGTAALLREPVAFAGKEHFNAALHRCATAGCPISGPDGGIVAIVGVICDRPDAARLLLGFLKVARRLLEASLFERMSCDGFLLRLRCGDEAGGGPLSAGRLFIAQNGRVCGADRDALDILGAGDAAAILGKDAATTIGVDLPALNAASDAADIVTLVARGAGGRVVAAEVHRTAKRRSAPTFSSGASPAGEGAPRHPANAFDGAWSDSVLDSALRKATGLQERNISILITGESGVGKDHLVRRLHASGPRKDRPLVAINCAAIPRELIESELFGYEGGSFTGARAKGKAGKFVEADKGILFLDEIGDMALDLQATLLRVLDSSEVTPIGSSKPIRVDVRVVAATNRSLQEMVQKGAFRRDLYYRLNGVQLRLPSLRERPDRLRLLAHLFRLEQEALGVTETMCFEDDVWRVFDRHPWPGNIREARNVLRSSIAVARGKLIAIDDLPADFLQELNADCPGAAEACQSASRDAQCAQQGDETSFDLADWEARAVRFALASSNGNIAKAARNLGITRATLYHKMARFGLRSDKRIISKR